MTTPQQAFFLLIKRLAYSLLLLFSFSLPFAVQAQQTDNWYFGSPTVPNAGLRINFSGPTPVVTRGYPIATDEGSSSISDASGNPLFYTDGISVWNASTNVSFGTATGGKSSTQSAIVMPHPANTSKWLLFTSGTNGSPGLTYYTVTGASPTSGPFTLSAGTNLIPAGVAGEGQFIIGSTKASSAFWVISRVNGTNGEVRAFEVDNTGAVNTTPVVSYLSGATNTTYSSKIGTIKSNTCQNKLAFTYLNADVDITDFDAATGQVVAGTNKRITIPATSGNNGSYGIEFSANDKYLYITNLAGNNLSRYDIAANTVNNAFGSTSYPAGQLQTAPDGKIYMGIQGDLSSGNGYLGVITNPGLAGATFSATGLLVTTAPNPDGFSYWGLPTFPKSLVVSQPEITPVSGGDYCLNASIPLGFTFLGPVNTSTIVWDVTSGTGGTFTPGGATSTNATPSVAFSVAGSKTIRLRFDDNCGRSYTQSITITVSAPKNPVGAVTCSAPNIVLSNTNSDPDAPNYIWYRNSVSTSNVMGTGSPLNYLIGNDASRPTQVCLGVSTTTPSVATSTNKTIAGSNTLSGIFAMSPYTSPTFDVLADKIVLKSFKFGFRYSTFYGPLNITITIKQGATTIFTNTLNNMMIPDGSIYTAAVNTTIQKGTGYTITVSTNKDGLEMQSSTWTGATNANEITYNGGAGSGYAVASLNYDAYNYTITPACSANPCYSVTCSLPVEWVSFDAKKKGNDVLLKWGLGMEKDNDRFEVQRSADGVNFVTIGTLPSKGNYNGYREYSYLDTNPLTTKAYYRVIQYDANGLYTTSNIALVYPSDVAEFISVYPNPSNNLFNIEWFGDVAAHYEVYDVRGAVVGTGTLNAANGVQTIGENFVSGVYIIKITSAEKAFNVKLIKQ